MDVSFDARRPYVEMVLGTSLSMLLKDADSLFRELGASDIGLLRAFKILISVHLLRVEEMQYLHNDVLGVTSVAIEGLEKRRSLVESLREIERRLDDRVNTIMKAIINTDLEKDKIIEGRGQSRLALLSKSLGLSFKEVKALTFILLFCLGRLRLPERLEKLGLIHNMSEFAGMDEDETLQFFSPSRRHLAQGLIEVDEEFSHNFGGATVKMPREVMTALVGGDLPVDDYLKIADTDLAQILDKEPNSKFADVLVQEKKIQSPVRLGGQLSMEELDKVLQELGEGEASEDISEPADNKTHDRSPADTHEGMKEEDPHGPLSTELPQGEDSRSEQTTRDDQTVLSAYDTDLEYLEDAFKFIAQRIKRYNLDVEEDQETYQISLRQRKPEAIMREMDAKERQARSRWERRLQLTRLPSEDQGSPRPEGCSMEEETDIGAQHLNGSPWLPKLELLTDKQHLDEFEKVILLTLIGDVLSQDVRKALGRTSSTSRYYSASGEGLEVGFLLGIHCTSLKEQIEARRYFYKGAALIKSGIVRVSERRHLSGDLTSCLVSMDRRMLDYLAGLRTELADLIEGSTCFRPTISLEQVVLPASMKKLLETAVQSYPDFARVRKLCGLDQLLSYGRGLVILLWGPSGTGKTMTAHALAHTLGKRLLALNLASSVTDTNIDEEAFQLIFREAELQDALVFLDECECLFERRERGRPMSPALAAALRALERLEGLLILATSRPQDLDPAMHRRVSLSVHFPMPDAPLRQQIWKRLVPPGLRVHSDVDWRALATDFELTGGYIKNAILQALQFAMKDTDLADTSGEVKRHSIQPKDIVLRNHHFRKASQLQIRGQLETVDLDRTVAPTHGLDALVLDKEVHSGLSEVVMFEKAHKLLAARWGFDDPLFQPHGYIALFYGGPGVGKSLAAEAVGYETGKSIRVANCSELLRLRGAGVLPVSASTARSGGSFDGWLRESRTAGAIVVLEGAEALIGSLGGSPLFCGRDPSNNVPSAQSGAAQAIVYSIMRSPGLTILICTTTAEAASFDAANGASYATGPQSYEHQAIFRSDALSSLLKFIVYFPAPGALQRTQLWRRLLPPQVPLNDDIDFVVLANKFKVTGAVIKAILLRAAAKAATRFISLTANRDTKSAGCELDDTHLSEQSISGQQQGLDAQSTNGASTIDDRWHSHSLMGNSSCCVSMRDIEEAAREELRVRNYGKNLVGASMYQ